MKYESPTLSLMGQMEELTGSWGYTWYCGDALDKCVTPETTYLGGFYHYWCNDIGGDTYCGSEYAG